MANTAKEHINSTSAPAANDNARNTASKPRGMEELTDSGDAKRLYRLKGQDFKYMQTIESFLLWTGARWEIQKNDTQLIPYTAVLPENIRAEGRAAAALVPGANDKERQEIYNSYEKHAKAVQGARNIKNILYLMKSEPGAAISQHDLDARPWLLNFKNGTFDIKGGVFKPHDRTDLITKCINVEYDANATCPKWEKTLEKFLPDPDVRAYFQRAAGYSITGSMQERCYFIAWGNGKNGKSTIINPIRDLLGDYGSQADSSVFFDTRYESALSNGVARFRGCRFVSASENKEGAALKVELIKQWTGKDTITARFLHQEFFEFNPCGKIWLTTNHRPKINDTNRAIWDRTHLIPFEVTITEAEIVLDMENELKAEYPGILNWLLRGCSDWQEEGLNPPAKVNEAIEEYRKNEDPIRGFVDERYDYNDNEKIAAGEFYRDYDSWCKVNGLHPASNVKFAKCIQDSLGLKKIEQSGTKNRFYIGICMKPEVMAEVEKAAEETARRNRPYSERAEKY